MRYRFRFRWVIQEGESAFEELRLRYGSLDAILSRRGRRRMGAGPLHPSLACGYRCGVVLTCKLSSGPRLSRLADSGLWVPAEGQDPGAALRSPDAPAAGTAAQGAKA